MLNTIVLCMTHWRMSETWDFWLFRVNIVFTLIFVVECILKFFAFGAENYWRDTWNVFDLITVLFALLEILLTVVQLEGVNLTFLRMLRMFRAMRLIKLLRSGDEIRVLLMTFAKSLRAIPDVALMVLLLFFIYAILGMFSFCKNLSNFFYMIFIILKSFFYATVW